MNRNELDRLIQDELEGLATPEARERLRQILAGSEEARSRREELAAVFQALDQVVRERAPVEIEEGVLAAIAADHETAAARRSRTDTARAARPRWAGPGWAAPFLAGAVAGGLVIALVAGPLGLRGRTGLPVSGTLPPPEAEAPRTGVPGLSRDGLPAVRQVAGGVQVRFAAPRGAGSELTLAYDPQALAPLALRWARAGNHRATLEPGLVRLELAEGDQGVLTLAPLRAGDAAIRFTTRGVSGTVQGTLHTFPGPGRE